MTIHKKIALLVALLLTFAVTVAVNAQDNGATTTSDPYWRAEYFNNPNLAGAPALVRADPAIDDEWGNESPAPGVINTDQFSVRWTRDMELAAGSYQFMATVDDGVRLWVNNQLLIDQWANQPRQAFTATVTLPGGVIPIRMEYFDDSGVAVAHLAWTALGSTQAPPTGVTATALITGTQNLNVRSGPSTDFTVLTSLPSGQLITLSGRNSDASWLQVQLADGRLGWVSSLYLTPNLALAQLPVTTAATQPVAVNTIPTAVVTNTQVLNVRTGPSLTSNLLTNLNSGQFVLLQARSSDNAWLQVRLPDGQLGWVSSLYVAPAIALTDVPVASATQPGNVGGEAVGFVVGAGILNVRSGPATTFNAISTLADGQSVGLEGRNADGAWLQIRLADGSLGWVSSTYVIPNLLRTDLPVVQ